MNRIKYIIAAVLVSLSFTSCLSVEEKKDKIAIDAYKDIINIGTENYRDDQAQGGSKIGFVSGPCAFLYSHWLGEEFDLSITVRYSVLNYPISTETGDLEDLHISEECGLVETEKYYPVSIRGRWHNRDFAGSGDFTMTLSKSKELCVFIFGDGNWKHWQSYQLSQEQFKKILAMFNSARQKTAALDGTACEDIKMDILREKADDGLAKEIFGAGYDYECDEEYDGQQQLLQ